MVLAAVLASACSVSVTPTREPVAASSAEDPAPTVAAPVSPASSGAEPDSGDDQSGDAEQVPTATPATSVFADLAPGQYRVVIDTVLGHDPEAFSQGLVFDGDRLYESRGLYGQSALTEIDAQTGEVISVGDQARRVDLSDDVFAEGLALVDDRLIQLTWQEQRAFVWDAETFEPVGQFGYEGEGWGLCHDGADLWMSNGSASLTRRDATDFTALEVVDVTLDGQPLVRLNELECIHGSIWANVWLTDLIAVIDPVSGEVVATIDASGLLDGVETTGNEDVLNGIAYDPVRDVVVLTGKNWPAMFEISLVPA